MQSLRAPRMHSAGGKSDSLLCKISEIASKPKTFDNLKHIDNIKTYKD